MTRLAIVSPYFPPSYLAGVHRARHLANHLPEHGIEPIVLTVDPAFHEERTDPDLMRLVAPGTEVISVAAIRPSISRLAGIGDIGLRSYRPLRSALIDLLKSGRADAVMITGAPYYPMLLASELKRRFGTPIILDFQDPWVSAWGASQPTLSKAGLSHRLAVMLEPRAMRSAGFVTSVSENQNQEMRNRYRWLSAERMAAIPIGGDAEDFRVLRDAPIDIDGILARGLIHLSYVGTCLPRMDPVLRALFAAVRQLREETPAMTERVRLNFIGTSNQPNDTQTQRVLPIAAQEGVADLVREIPQRIPYLPALAVVARSHAVLALGSDEPHYTASKIYAAMMSGRPVLSIFHQASSAHEILNAAGALAHGFRDHADLDVIVPVLTESLRRLIVDQATIPAIDRAAYARFEARSIAGEYAAIVRNLTGR
jgi:hypothetical protein